MNFVILPGQLRLALCLCYGGMVGGVLYDVLSPLRKSRYICWAADLLFGLLTAGGYALALAYCRETKIRLPGLLFYAVGFGLYRMGIRRLGLVIFRFVRRRLPHGRRKKEA